jgi:hypothetical protein
MLVLVDGQMPMPHSMTSQRVLLSKQDTGMKQGEMM